MLKVLTVVLISSFGFALALSSSNKGLAFALPGTNAFLKLEVLNAPNVLFNRKGTTTFKLSHPFGKTLIQGLPNGTPDKTEPDVPPARCRRPRARGRPVACNSRSVRSAYS